MRLFDTFQPKLIYVTQSFAIPDSQMLLILRNTLRMSNKHKQKELKRKPQISPQYLKHLQLFQNQKTRSFEKKVLPQSGKQNFLITAALPYINNVPHLGNIIGALLSADVIARYRRQKGQNVLFITGTDEYGTATEIKARKEGKTPREICDQFHILHKQIYDWFQISFNHFGRTSKPCHSEVVNQIFQQIKTNRDFFAEKQTSQMFCQNCDMFLADRYVVGNCKSCGSVTKADQCDTCNKVFDDPETQILNKKCKVCQHEPSIKKSKHLFINYEGNLKIQSQLNEWLQKDNKAQNWTKNAKGTTKAWIRDSLKDRCITRDLKWGVEVAGFQNKVFYVWFDAPIGYISMTKDLLEHQYEKWWKQSEDYRVELIQFMGKDNIIFHSVIFPSTLLEASKHTSQGYKTVDQIRATEYLRYEGGKFSKSEERGVFGNDCISSGIEVDIWRYYLLANRPEGFDTEFSWVEFAEKNKKDLMNSIGNLYNRILKVVHKDPSVLIESLNSSQFMESEHQLLSKFRSEVQRFFRLLEHSQIKQGAACLLELSFVLNKYVQDTSFWNNPERKSIVLSLLMRTLSAYGLLLEPYLPVASSRVLYLMGLEHKDTSDFFAALENNFESALLEVFQSSTGVKEPILLFRPISEQTIESMRQKHGSKKDQRQV